MSRQKQNSGKTHKARFQIDALVAVVNLTAALVNLLTALILLRIALGV